MFTLQESIDYYINSQSRLLAPESTKIYESSLGFLPAYLGSDILLEDITKRQLIEWREWLVSDHDLSMNTVRRIMGHTRTFFRWYLTLGVLDSSPADGVKMPKPPDAEPKAISIEDFQKLLEAAAVYLGGKWPYAQAYVSRNQAILYFLASTGCRVGGLVSAELSTFRLVGDGAECRVTEKARGGGRQRQVMLSETAAIAVLEWLDHRPPARHDFIFCGIEGKSKSKPLSTTAVRQFLIRLAKRAGVDGRFNPHSFRHACAREWLRNGADLQTVSQLLGHSEIGVTSKFYARWSNSELRERHKMVDWTKTE